jgi:hypothetical protein
MHAVLEPDPSACDNEIRFNYNPGPDREGNAGDTAYRCTKDKNDPKGQIYACNPGEQAPPTFEAGSTLSAGCTNQRLVTASLDASAPKTDPSPVSASPGPAFLDLATWERVLADLRLSPGNQVLGHYYNQSKDVAVIFLDADATPYFPMLDVIDENDDIYVAFVDTEARLASAEISVQGCDRTPSLPRFYGSIPPSSLLGRQAGGGTKPKAEEDRLQVVVRAVGRCAGADTGGPQVTIRTASGQSHSIAIPVNPLYRFAIGLGVGVDFTMNRSFDVRTANGETAPSITETRDMEGITTQLLFSMYFVPRDFRKKDVFWQKMQLFLGLEPNSLKNSLTVGLGYELGQGINLLAGWRALVKQPVLAEGSGLAVGSFFSGTKDTIPTRDRWEIGLPFVGLGLSTDILSRIR